jgi:8-oxo-dGTP diphosphatase
MNSQNGIVLVASVSIIKDDKVLIIQENKPQVYKKWGFPAGRIEQGEDICQAACREAKEETGFDVELISTTGIYNFISSSNDQVIMFHFLAEVTGGFLKLDETEILDCRWVTQAELKNFDSNNFRESSITKQILKQLEKEEFYSMSIYK